MYKNGLKNTLNHLELHNPLIDGEIEAYQETNSAQKEIWTALTLLPEATYSYNECLIIKWNEALDLSILKQAYSILINKHAGLRSTFSPDGKIQMFHRQSEINLKNFLIDTVLTKTADQTQTVIKEIANTEVKKRFELTTGAPVRLCAIIENESLHCTILTYHHIICDGESAYFLINELSNIYLSLLTKTPIKNESVFPEKLKSADSNVLDFWKVKLKSINTDTTFKHLPHKKRQLFRSFNSQRFDTVFNSLITNGLKKNAKKHRVSLFTYVLSVFNFTLAKLNTTDSITLGLCTTSQSDSNHSIGHRIIVRPFTSELKKGSHFSTLLKSTDTRLMELLESPSISYGELVSQVKDRGLETGTSPLFSIVFNFDQNTKLPNLVQSVKTAPRTHENFEMFVNLYLTTENELALEVQYNTQIFTYEEIKTLFNSFQIELEKSIYGDELITYTKTAPDIKPNIDLIQNAQQQSNNNVSEHTTKSVIEIWSGRLKTKDLSATSHFFKNGGHSILALEIAKDLSKRFSINFSIKDVFINPTPAQQASAIEKLMALKPIAQNKTKNDDETLILTEPLTSTSEIVSEDLTISQLQIVFLEASQNVGALHNLPAAILVKDTVDKQKLNTALTSIISNNEAFRSFFKRENGKIVRKTAPANLSKNFKIDEISSTKEEIISLLNADAKSTFELDQWPLMRAKLCRTTNGETILYFNFHHIIWDGWCFDLFFEELNKAYFADDSLYLNSLNNSSSSLAFFEKSYLKSQQGELDKLFWKNMFSKPVSRIQLPTLPVVPEHVSSSAESLSLEINENLKQKIETFAKQNSTSIYLVLLTCFKITLSKYAQTSDVIIGVPVQNRSNDTHKKSFGYFVNTLPVRTLINIQRSFIELISDVQSQFFECLTHQQLPFFEIKRFVKDESRNDFITALFSFQEVSGRKSVFNNKPYTQINLSNKASHTPLDMWIKYSDKKIEGGIQYKNELFSKAFIENFAELFIYTLNSAIDNYTQSLTHLTCSPSQNNELLKWGNGLNKAIATTVNDRFDYIAKTYSSKTAVSCESMNLSYSELDSISNRLAYQLFHKHGNRRTKVGVCLERTSHLPAVILAIFKCGYTYIPLDHTFPSERLHYIVADSELDILITEKNISYRPTRKETSVFYLSELIETQFPKNQNFKPLSPKPTDISYIIYTSGTTGTPKGVSVSYFALENFVMAMQHENIVSDVHNILAHTTICFDISFLEIVVPLLTGARVHLVNKTEILTPDDINNVIKKYDINFIQSTPSAWKILMAQNWKPCSKEIRILSGGERLPQEVAEYLLSCSTQVYNMYGPTETTVWSTFQNVKNSSQVNCGKPILNTQLLILGQNDEVLPPYASGELYISGYGLSSGYYQKPELTEKKFKIITSHLMSGTFYATGDLARWNDIGELEILGRNDRQIKINGYRLELFEIESRLRLLQLFQDVHVFVINNAEYQTLAAALVMIPGKTISEEKLRSELLQHLPHYMIPQEYVFVDEMPRTTSLKADENTLSFLVKNKTSSSEVKLTPKSVYDKPDTNQIIRNTWCEHLEVDTISDEATFFELGGHSLIALNLNTHLEELLGLKIPLRYLIESKSFLDFCKKVESLNEGSNVDTKSLIILKNGIKKSKTLFCFHAVGGSALNYSVLSSYIDPDQYLVGFQTIALNGVTPMSNSIEEMSRDYVKELLEFQPQGPYSLCGGSMGGTIAYEVAQQLVNKGHKIEKLILFDTFGPDVDLTKFSAPLDKIKDVARKLIKPKQPAIRPMALIDQITRKNYELLFKYRAKPYHGNIWLIRSTRTLWGSYSEPYLGWKSAIKGKIYITEINATHEAFIEDLSFKDAFIKFYKS